MTAVAHGDGVVHATDMLGDLRELIAALDRRVPRLERCGELKIARDAAALRESALRLINEIESAAPKAP